MKAVCENSLPVIIAWPYAKNTSNDCFSVLKKKIHSVIEYQKEHLTLVLFIPMKPVKLSHAFLFSMLGGDKSIW